jgi:hypothetical protein
MPGLLDIGDLTEEVPIGKGRTLTVRGLSYDDLYRLVGRHPALMAVLSGQFKDHIEAIKQQAPETITDVIACAAGDGGEKSAKIARALPISSQVKALTAIMTLTFEEGVRPFVERLSAMKTKLIGQPSDTDSQEPLHDPYVLTDEPKPPRGKARHEPSTPGTNSPTQSAA